LQDAYQLSFEDEWPRGGLVRSCVMWRSGAIVRMRPSYARLQMTFDRHPQAEFGGA
jgi:hypothetical protein